MKVKQTNKESIPPNKKPAPRKAGNLFLEGLVVLMPLSLSVYVVYLLVNWTRNFLSFTLRFLPQSYQHVAWLQIVVEIAAVIVIVLFIILIGWFTKTVIGKFFGRTLESIIQKLPFISSLYKALKQLFKTFVSYKGTEFSRAVLIQYPHPGIWSIAFLTSEATGEIKPDKRKEYYTVFMPSTPNPTTGFVMIIPKKDVKLLDISIEEAVKIVMSGGLIQK